jgi:hypothetical protein
MPITDAMPQHHTFAQLIRFALVGGAANIAYALLFMTVHDSGPLFGSPIGARPGHAEIRTSVSSSEICQMRPASSGALSRP